MCSPLRVPINTVIKNKKTENKLGIGDAGLDLRLSASKHHHMPSYAGLFCLVKHGYD